MRLDQRAQVRATGAAEPQQAARLRSRSRRGSYVRQGRRRSPSCARWRRRRRAAHRAPRCASPADARPAGAPRPSPVNPAPMTAQSARCAAAQRPRRRQRRQQRAPAAAGVVVREAPDTHGRRIYHTGRVLGEHRRPRRSAIRTGGRGVAEPRGRRPHGSATPRPPRRRPRHGTSAAMQNLQRLCVGTNFSPESDLAVRAATTLARATGAHSTSSTSCTGRRSTSACCTATRPATTSRPAPPRTSSR